MVLINSNIQREHRVEGNRNKTTHIFNHKTFIVELNRGAASITEVDTKKFSLWGNYLLYFALYFIEKYHTRKMWFGYYEEEWHGIGTLLVNTRSHIGGFDCFT